MKKEKKKKWVYEGNNYFVGDSLRENFKQPNNCFPLVFFENRLYKAYIKFKRNSGRVCLVNVYNSKNKYWVNINRVFHVIKE